MIFEESKHQIADCQQLFLMVDNAPTPPILESGVTCSKLWTVGYK